jgi:hypothetical protein
VFRRPIRIIAFISVSAAFWLVGLWASGLTPIASAACTPLLTTVGTVTVSNFVAPVSGNYYIWVRLSSPSQGKSSVYLQVGSHCGVSMGGGSVPVGGFTWIDYQNGNTSSRVTLTSLAAGKHNLTLAGKDPGVEVDKILLLTDPSCIPVNSGVNCQPTGTAAIAATASTTSVNDTISTVAYKAALPVGLFFLIGLGAFAWLLRHNPLMNKLTGRLSRRSDEVITPQHPDAPKPDMVYPSKEDK